MTDPSPVKPFSEQACDQFLKHRLEKLEALRKRGIDPFAVERYVRSHSLKAVRDGFDQLEGQTVSVAGRIVAVRPMGRASFMHIEDASGRLQIYFRQDQIGAESYELLDLLDIGDIIGVQGTVFRTRTGEVTVMVSQYTPMVKALRPPPIGKQRGDQEWGGLSDIETRYRQRYLDLMANPEVRQVMMTRSRIVSAVRRFYDQRGYLEVETPVLQAVAGGAAARPFITHHNALDHDFHLRISLELYLKRLLVGGFEKVYEIGRCFRNEGISVRHNPEYTLLESYEAYSNLEDIMELVEDLFAYVVQEVHGSLEVPYGDQTLCFRKPWPRIKLLEAIQERTGVSPREFETLEKAKTAGEHLGLPMEQEHSIGGIIEKILERFVQPTLIQPTFVVDYPIETSPLAKKRADNPRLVRRFEAYIGALEVANAFSEINDPLDQRERFTAQAKLRAAGDEEAHPMDEDFLRALEYGMPPAGGLGIGIDRMVMVLTNQQSIRDVILFPQMRPESRANV
ncbi:MAG: lysine--tRNA ligase [Armatimonadota bacterium]